MNLPEKMISHFGEEEVDAIQGLIGDMDRKSMALQAMN
jgi:hypothetical protein